MGQRRTHFRISALALGAVAVLFTTSVASASQRGGAARQRATSHAVLTTQTGRLFGVATTQGGGAWAVGYAGTLSDSRTLALHWNGAHWQPEPSPSPPGAELRGVAATSPTNVWAVGSDGDAPNSETLILHWNGKKWARLPGSAGALFGVAATSLGNAWAVGSSNQGDTVTLHWNGKRWLHIPSPGVGTLYSVTATSPSNAWAVGTTNSGNSTLILHWNGQTWQQTPSPNVGADQGLGSALSGIAVSSHRVVWAVGEGGDCGCGPGVSLIVRWNGKTWNQVRNPAGLGSTNLSAVVSLASGDAWAVGWSGEGDSPTSSAILRWNGSAWVGAQIPVLRGDAGGLTDVVATSRTNAWAVGWEGGGAGGEYGNTGNPEILILRWNGSEWTPLTTVGPSKTPAVAGGTTTTFAPSTSTSTSTSTTTTAPVSTTTLPSTPSAGAPLLGSAAWGQALGPTAGISGFGEVAPTSFSLGGEAPSPQVESISWSNWGAAEATGQGESIDGMGQSGPVSSWPLKPVTVVAFDLGSCSGGPLAYQEVAWYFPEDGQTFNANSATNACTGQ